MGKQDLNKAPSNSGGALHMVASARVYQGPFPDPDSLEKYEQVLPGFSQSLMTTFEKEAANRQKIEMIQAVSEKWTAILSLLSTFIIVMSLIGFAGYSIFCGKDSVANTTVATTIVAFAGVFIYRKVTRPSNRK